jgi:hypothetical protein
MLSPLSCSQFALFPRFHLSSGRFSPSFSSHLNTTPQQAICMCHLMLAVTVPNVFFSSFVWIASLKVMQYDNRCSLRIVYKSRACLITDHRSQIINHASLNTRHSTLDTQHSILNTKYATLTTPPHISCSPSEYSK